MARRAKTRSESKRETRRALLDAALAEFAEKGLDGSSLDAICARAGYTRGAFYVHFRDREDLLVGAMELVLGTFLDTIIGTRAEPQSLADTVGRFAAAVVDRAPALLGQGAVRFHHILEGTSRSPHLRSRFLGLWQEAVTRVRQAAEAGQRAGTVRQDVAAEPLATMLAAIALGVAAMLEAGASFDVGAARDAVRALLAPSKQA